MTASPADPFVLTFVDRTLDGWPPKARETARPPADSEVRRVPLSGALLAPAEYDTHLVQYDYEPKASGPLSMRRRLNVALLRDPAYWGDHPTGGIRLSCVFFDVDGDGHKWTPEWWAEERAKIEALRAELPGVFAYTTAGGYRLVGVLPEPFVIRAGRGCIEDEAEWKSRYRSWLRYLQRFGIAADPSCDQWNRHFRIPRATRDGELQNGETVGDARAIGVWAPVLREDEIVRPEPVVNGASEDYEPIPLSVDSDPGYWDYRVEPAVKYLERTAPVVCFATPGQTPKRRDAMLGICGVLLRKFRLPTEIAGELIESVYNPRIEAAGKTPWSRSVPGDYGMSINERLAAASEPTDRVSTADDILTETSWLSMREILSCGSTPPVAGSNVTPDASPPSAVEATASEESLGFSFGAWDVEPPPIEFIVDGLVPRGAIGVFFGRADSLKTWMLFDLAIAVASGKPWLGHATTKGRVGLVDFETGENNLRRRLYMLRAGANPNLGARSFSKLKPNVPAFWSALKRENLDLVIIDSLRKANPGADENDSGEAIVPLELAAEFSEATGCAVLFIHHAKKSSSDGWPEFRGSGAIEDQVDCAFAVRKVDVAAGRKRVEVMCSKPGDMRLPAPFAVEVTFDDVERVATVCLAAGGSEKAAETNKEDEMTSEEIQAAIRLALGRGPLETKEKIKKAVKGTRARVYAEIDAMIVRREIVKIEGVGFVLDDEAARRGRVLAQVRAYERWRSAAELAKAAHVPTTFVEGLVRDGVILPRSANVRAPLGFIDNTDRVLS